MEQEFPQEGVQTAEQREGRNRLARIGKQIIAAEWMSETESGPEELVERRQWLEDIGKARDERGRATTCYNVKKKGRAIYEVIPELSVRMVPQSVSHGL